MSDTLKMEDFLPPHIIGTLKLMEIAEEEITQAMQQHPLKAALLFDSFLTVTPTLNMTTLTPQVYRAHVRELLDRVIHKQDVRPGTLAEVMIALSEASLHAPLIENAGFLYARIFRSIFGEDAVPGLSAFRESHQGAANQIERDLRRKLTVANRHKPSPTRYQAERRTDDNGEQHPPTPPDTKQMKLF